MKARPAQDAAVDSAVQAMTRKHGFGRLPRGEKPAGLSVQAPSRRRILDPSPWISEPYHIDGL
jgi:hypothetical protein